MVEIIIKKSNNLIKQIIMKKMIHYYIVLRRKIIRPILRNKKISYYLSKHFLKTYLALFYENWTGKILNYKKPYDLNQKLMKLSWQNSVDPKMKILIPQCVDKFEVREYIKSKGYGETLNELYGVYEDVNDIDFDSLPEQFVMKITNASARNFICIDKSKCNFEEIKKQFSEWIQDVDFGWQSGEWQYSLIKPRIVIEKYLKDLGSSSLIDYKASVYNGKVEDFLVCYNRDSELTKDCYDIDWNRTNYIKDKWHTNRKDIPKPTQLDQMIKMAEECSKDFKYCRFDMYEIDGKIIFGEMTFTPNGNVLSSFTDDYLHNMKDKICV